MTPRPDSAELQDSIFLFLLRTRGPEVGRFEATSEMNTNKTRFSCFLARFFFVPHFQNIQHEGVLSPHQRWL